MSRGYGQYCGLARALDVVGDRWNLLIVRQLLVTPARYRDLRQALPGIATNLLADRLRDLETAGVLERRLGDDGAVTYALTDWGGAQLREPVEGLIRWSTPMMVRGPRGRRVPSRMADPRAARPVRRPSYRPNSDRRRGRRRRRRAGPRHPPAGIEVTLPDIAEFDAVLRADAQIVLGLATGMLTLDDMAELVDIDGDKAAVRTLFRRVD